MNAEDLMQQMNAAAASRWPGYGLLIFLGPGGSVSPMLQMPVSSMRNFIPSLRYMFGEDLAAGTGFFEEDYAYLPRRSKRARVAATSEAILGLQEVTPREGEQCAVCLQDFRADEKLRAMPPTLHL
ncbi:hypothetical protein C2845_PM06G16330 [Panicum miliaceum]|uniref:Uncharacterized protein n=1 Tax=Panicum miliaceum TaxID=4540 RepID=A0A3L6RBY5_PANMI|nr:hypothetical protein C2845_PM06G16330 [Panicum miliaceum]